MRLKNKKTGEIVDAHEIDLIDKYVYLRIFRAGDYDTKQYNSLAELNDEWEDYEEPKEYWHIFGANITKTQEGSDELYDKRNKEIGNYFESKEEAEKAREKLKARQRLKDKGFKFDRWFTVVEGELQVDVKFLACDGISTEDKADLDLLFSGEDD